MSINIHTSTNLLDNSGSKVSFKVVNTLGISSTYEMVAFPMLSIVLFAALQDISHLEKWCYVINYNLKYLDKKRKAASNSTGIHTS